MSPVSRGRKKKGGRRPSGGKSRPSQRVRVNETEMLIDSLRQAAHDDGLVDTDVWAAEGFGGLMGSVLGPDEDVAVEAATRTLIPDLEREATRESLAMILALGAVLPEPAHSTTAAAAARLTDGGLAAPRWLTEISAPLTGTRFQLLHDDEDTVAILVGTWERSGTTHGFVVITDPDDCDAASEITPAPGDQLAAVVAQWRESVGVPLTTRDLTAEEFRWQAERALGTFADHARWDREEVAAASRRGGSADVLTRDEIELIHGGHALLLRNRLRALPAPARPQEPHPRHKAPEESVLYYDERGQIVGHSAAPRDRPAPVRTLPAQPRKRTGPVPIYQLRVDLVGAKPPIWRRLEVPADVTLGRLHTILQAAFDWEFAHPHVFDTPHGTFGDGSGARPESSATLEQVLPKPKSSIVYIYDFGDDWRHAITCEKVTEPDPGSRYPRCTAGGGAAPPEDCGGIWGYQMLVDIVADPRHPEYHDRREWMGLEDGQSYDPEHFTVESVNAQFGIRA